MKIERILVTPKIAEKWLKSNDSNRGIRKAVVEKYAKEMANGHWREDTAETIKISKAGDLLDGQHRLMALIKAGKSFHFHVATDMDADVFGVLDTGSKRTAHDVFKIAGIKYESVMPSIIATWYVIGNGSATSHGGVDKRPSNTELLEFYRDDETFWLHVAERAMTWYKTFGKIITPSMLGGYYAYFYSKDADMAARFMQAVADGIDAPHISALLFRNRMISDKTSMRKLPQSIKDALLIKAWNAYRQNSKMKQLKFDPSVEEMPVAL